MGCIQKLHGAGAKEQGKTNMNKILHVNDVSDTNFNQLDGIQSTVHWLLTCNTFLWGIFVFFFNFFIN